MALGDLTAAVRTDGWTADVTIEGRAAWLGAAAYDFGTAGATSTSKLYFAVTSEGYSSSAVLGTIARKVYGTKLVRMPSTVKAIPGTISNTLTHGRVLTQATTLATCVVYGSGQGSTHAHCIAHSFTGTPNGTDVWTEATSGYTVTPSGAPAARTNDERDVGSDLVLRSAGCSDVYNDDTVTLTAAAGWASSGGNNSNAASAIAVTNSSTLDYPVAFGQWDFYAGAMHATAVKESFRLAFTAFHGWGIACVKFVATGATSGHSVTETVSVQTRTKRTATNLWGYSFRSPPIPLTGFTQGETIQCVATCYPRVGDEDAIFSTTGTTQTDEIKQQNRLDLICDKNDALDVIRYVSTTGNNTTGDGSSGNPWATPDKAYLTAGVTHVKLMGTGTTYDMGTSGTRRTTDRWIIVEPDTGATPTVRFTATVNYRLQRLMFRNLTITVASTSSYLSGENAGNLLAFVGCAFTKGAVGTPMSAPFSYRSDGCFLINCTGDLSVRDWAISSFSTNRVAMSFDGVDFGQDAAGATSITCWYRVVACETDREIFGQKPTANPAPDQNGVIFAWNRIRNIETSSGRGLQLVTVADQSNVGLWGNIVEKTAGTDSCVHIAADGTGFTATNFVIGHNTVIGSSTPTTYERCNLFYNDAGGTAYNHRHIFCIGNNWRPNIKSDQFAIANTSITRVGTTATLTKTAHGYVTGDYITVEDATPSGYNGTYQVTVTGANTLTYVMAADPGSSASAPGISGKSGTRIGNWPQLYGVNWRSNNETSDDGFEFEYGGIDATESTPAYADFANEDFGPDTGSPLLDRVSHAYWPHHFPGDLFGNYLSTDSSALACVGAVQPVPTLAVTVDGEAAAEDATVDIGQQSAGESIDVVATVSGLTGATVYIEDYATDAGIAEVAEFVPEYITVGGTTTNTATLRLEQGTSTAAITLTSSYGDGDFDFDIEWEEQLTGAVRRGRYRRGRERRAS